MVGVWHDTSITARRHRDPLRYHSDHVIWLAYHLKHFCVRRVWYAQGAVESGFCSDGSAARETRGGVFVAVGPQKRRAGSRYGPRRNGEVV